jgi:hypothetical protein
MPEGDAVSIACYCPPLICGTSAHLVKGGHIAEREDLELEALVVLVPLVVRHRPFGTLRVVMPQLDRPMVLRVPFECTRIHAAHPREIPLQML